MSARKRVEDDGKSPALRERNGLTQVDAASLLGVSQPYLSLLEKGARPLTATLRNRMKTVRPADRRVSSDDRFRAGLSAFGYPAFAHVPPARPKSILGMRDADARVVEALPWLVRRYADQRDLDWLVRQAKLQNLQNRLGFVLASAGVELPALSTAVHELERARLLHEATLCWDSMPTATRETADLDVLAVIPRDVARRVVQLAGEGSVLQRKRRLQSK